MDWHKAALLLFWIFQNFSALAQESFQLIEDLEYLPRGNPRQKLDLFVRPVSKRNNLHHHWQNSETTPACCLGARGGWQHGDKKVPDGRTGYPEFFKQADIKGQVSIIDSVTRQNGPLKSRTVKKLFDG